MADRWPIDPDSAPPPPHHLAGHDRHWDLLLVIAAGGAIGSLARWALTRLLPVAPDVPWATVVANLLGCLALGVLMVVVLESHRPHHYVRPFLGIGVLGGFTTFSTYALDVRTLAADGRLLVAALYLVGSVVGGLLAVGLGIAVTRAVTSADERAQVAP